MSNIDDIQKQRGSTYGSFSDNATVYIKLQNIIIDAVENNEHHGDKFTPEMMLALTMSIHKISRIVNGNPEYLDSWIDAESYLNLGRKSIENKVTG